MKLFRGATGFQNKLAKKNTNKPCALRINYNSSHLRTLHKILHFLVAANMCQHKKALWVLQLHSYTLVAGSNYIIPPRKTKRLLLFVKFHATELLLVSVCTRTIMICNDHNTGTFILKPPIVLVLTPLVQVWYTNEQSKVCLYPNSIN